MIPIIGKRRQNRFIRSQELDNTYWAKQGTTLDANSTTAPDGSLTAETFRKNGVSSTVTRQVYRSVTLPNNEIVTLSVFGKAKEYNQIQIQYLRQDNTTPLGRFNLDTQTVATAQGLLSYGITPLKDGWSRCWITFNVGAPTGSTTPRLAFLLGNSGTFSWSDTGTQGVYLWGAQYEYNNLSNYIATAGAQVI